MLTIKNRFKAPSSFSAMFLKAVSILIRMEAVIYCWSLLMFSFAKMLLICSDVSSLYSSTNVKLLYGSFNIGAIKRIDWGLPPISLKRWWSYGFSGLSFFKWGYLLASGLYFSNASYSLIGMILLALLLKRLYACLRLRPSTTISSSLESLILIVVVRTKFDYEISDKIRRISCLNECLSFSISLSQLSMIKTIISASWLIVFKMSLKTLRTSILLLWK